MILGMCVVILLFMFIFFSSSICHLEHLVTNGFASESMGIAVNLTKMEQLIQIYVLMGGFPFSQ